METHFKNRIEQIQNLLSQEKIQVVIEKEIKYGFKILLKSSSSNSTFDLLYSARKKAFSFTFKKGSENFAGVIAKSLESLDMKVTTPTVSSQQIESFEHKYSSWTGSDESGKGDFFGPLVTAVFHCSKDIAKVLNAIGVTDSKALNDRKIVELAKQLYKAYPERINCIVLRPERYNTLYADMVKQGKKLNEMLDWLHTKTIEPMLSDKSIEGMIIDQYSKSGQLRNKLSKLFKNDIIIRPKAETDPAVAAASIIARYQFINAIEMMGRTYKMKFPKGASSPVISAAKIFVRDYDKDSLSKVAKIHFKTMEKL